MSPSPLFFRRLEIQRMPGIDRPGFAVEKLVKGINVIHGPNAAGKTTLARAIQALLWPDRAAPENAVLRGRFDWDGDDWLVKWDSSAAEHQRNGSVTSPPPLPGAEQRDRYNLSLHQLLQAQTRNRNFAERILRESAGGYDLGEAEGQIDLRTKPSPANHEVDRKASNAIEAFREARSRAQDLQQEKNRLTRLRDRRKQARRAMDRRELIDQAIEYVRAKTALEEAEDQLNEYPPVLEEVSGNEIERLEKLEEEIQELKRRREQNESRINEAETQLDEAGFPGEGLPEDLLTRCKQQRDRLKSREENLANIRSTLEEKRAERTRERRQLDDEISDEKLEKLDRDGMEELADFARRSEEIRSRRTGLEALREWLRPEESPADLEDLKEGSRLLRSWLQRPAGGDGLERFHRIGLSACLIGLLAIQIAGLADPALPFSQPISIGLIVVSGGILMHGWLGSDRNKLRQAARREFSRLDLPAPAEWTPDSVRSTLRELRAEVTRARLAEEKTHRWQQREEELEQLQQEEKELEERRQSLTERFGLAPDTEESILYWTVNRISRWQDAHHRIEGLEEKLEETKEQHKDVLETLNGIFERYGETVAEDAAEASGRISRLEQRANAHRDARRSLEGAKRERTRIDEQLAEVRKSRETLFTELDLEPGDRAGLAELCERREDYLAAKQEQNGAHRVLEREKNKLREHPMFDPSLLDRSEGDLLNEKRELEEQARDYEELHERISGIEARIEDAKSTHDVEDALARKNRALDRLAKQLHEDYEELVAQQLVNHLRGVSHDRERPEVFKRARKILSNITQGRYRLEVDERGNPPDFRAVDTVRGEGYDLDQLSSGTRLQVLLSVRMAFVQKQESGAALPLIMDETLANTDDTRARSIIESTLELTRAGRQIFYFTAQGDEVAKWVGALQNQPDIPHRTIDLAEVRSLSDSVQVPAPEEIAVEVREYPTPDGLSHEEYAERISVPPFVPRRGAESAHLWYLVTDVDRLYRLLTRGIERWGPLKNLLEETPGEQLLGEESARRRLRENAAALEEFSECRRIGRGRRVDRSALENSEAVTENFIEEVAALTKRVDGRAESIIEALREGEVSGFRTQKMDELETFFREHNYLDPAEPLEPSHIRTRMIVAMETTGEGVEDGPRRVDDLLNRLEARK